MKNIVIIKKILLTTLTIVAFIITVQTYVNASELKIQSGDEIEIFVWNNKELSRDLSVKQDGTISLPLIGKVKAEGLTTAELENKLRESLKSYIKNPMISVIFIKNSNWVVYILGEVAGKSTRAGEYNYYKGMTLMELTAKSGGFTTDAKLKKIYIVRKREGKKRERFKVDLKAILEGRASDVELKLGDVVYLPKSGITAWNVFVRNILPSLNFIVAMAALSAAL